MLCLTSCFVRAASEDQGSSLELSVREWNRTSSVRCPCSQKYGLALCPE